MMTPPENIAGVKLNGKWNGMIGQLIRGVSKELIKFIVKILFFEINYCLFENYN